ncbi:glycosyltransferase family 32 protein [Jaapia argillacea MUCL 33604]|uniref:Glycosyltransferase family 32 protein n=1 Tax=Jaapia argillacea MUCL 33604 TaxID=933084 RepID=A0A067PDY5_9AGAM|nr:glycosyltransferase family 32 protein [Jaapia argillacea MUCL 33604]
MDHRKLALLVSTVVLLFYFSPRIYILFNLLHTNVTFPHMTMHILGDDDGFNLSNLTTAAQEEPWNNAVLIPKIIHQVYLGEPEESLLASGWEEARKSCIDLHPDWEFMVWDDEKGNQFVKENYPELLQTYLDYPYESQRSDILRLLTLHQYGGIYIDRDLRCLEPLDVFRSVAFLVAPTNPTGISNAFIVATPYHPFLEFVMSNIQAYDMGWGSSRLTISYSTGRQFWSTMTTLFKHLAMLTVLPQEFKLDDHSPPPIFEYQSRKGDPLPLPRPPRSTFPLLAILLSSTFIIIAAFILVKRKRAAKSGGGLGRLGWRPTRFLVGLFEPRSRSQSPSASPSSGSWRTVLGGGGVADEEKALATSGDP